MCQAAKRRTIDCGGSSSRLLSTCCWAVCELSCVHKCSSGSGPPQALLHMHMQPRIDYQSARRPKKKYLGRSKDQGADSLQNAGTVREEQGASSSKTAERREDPLNIDGKEQFNWELFIAAFPSLWGAPGGPQAVIGAADWALRWCTLRSAEVTLAGCNLEAVHVAVIGIDTVALVIKR